MRPRALVCALLALALPATAAQASSYGDTVQATPGVVAYWPLDEAAGPSVTDLVGQRSATLGNAAWGAAAGIDFGGTSVDFAGGAANFGATLDLTADRSIEAWVSERSTTTDRYIVSKGGSTTGYHLFYAAGGAPTFQVNGTRVTGAVLTRGTWHHIVATLAGRAMTLYVDGKVAGTGTLPADPATSTQSFWLGRLARANAGYWSGPLDEVAVYDRALDADTVAAHFAAGVDRSLPTSQFVTTPSAVTNASVARFTFMGSKTGLAFTCRLDGGAWTWCVDGTATYSGLADGEHTVEVRAIDRWGVIEAAPPVFRWTVDLTPPRSFLLVAQSTATRAATAIIGSEPGATFECRSVNGAWKSCPATFELPDIGKTYGLYVRATDAVGNVEAGESSAVIQPRPVGISFIGATAKFTASALNGRSSWSCRVDGGPIGDCPDTLAFPGLDYGNHTLQVSAPGVSGIVWPTIAWSDPLPVPLVAGAQFPALVARTTARLPRLLFQSNAPGEATLVLQRRGRTISRWATPVTRGANVVRLSRNLWRRVRPGRYVLGLQVANAAGASAPLSVRFDVVRATRR